MTTGGTEPGDEVRQQLAVAARVLYRNGADSNVGAQLTVRDPGGAGFWVAGFRSLDLVAPADVARVTWELEVAEGSFPRARALRAHADIYRRRPEVGAVVHTHSHWVVVHSSTGRPVGMYDITAVVFAGEQAVHRDDGVRPHSSVVDDLGDGRVVLIQNHGAIVAGGSLEEVVVDALTLEACARYDLECRAAGGTEILPAEVAAGRRDYAPGYRRDLWRDHVDRLRRSDPDLFP